MFLLEIIGIVLLGWSAGALVNYLADVLPERRRLVQPFCRNCGKDAAVLQYLFWPRRCSSCGRGRGLRSWLVEVAFITAFVWLWFRETKEPGFLVGAVLLVYFGLIVVIDLEHHLILHPVSIVGAVIMLGIGPSLHGIRETLLGGVAGFTLMLLIYLLGVGLLRLLSRRGRDVPDEAMGFGDVMLSGVLGFLLGWPGITVGLLLAVLLGGVFSLLHILVGLIFRKYRALAAIPYGPFLVAAAFLLLFFRQSLLQTLFA